MYSIKSSFIKAKAAIIPSRSPLRSIPSIHHSFLQTIRKLHIQAAAQPTIYALSTAPGKSAVAVIRISGTQSGYILQRLTYKRTIPAARKAVLRKLHSPAQDGRLLDNALVLFFKGPKSFTGEDLLELHLHGGVATVKSVLSSIQCLNDTENNRLIRYAENGEFTKRAFQNGRFDLTEAEGIRDMIDAETETQRAAAINSMEGYNKKFFKSVRERILHSSAMLSALIDFGDDYELEEVETLISNVSEEIQVVRGDVIKYLDKSEKAKILLNGIKITLLGPTNSGKSSLLNKIANRDAAIVSDIAGTTRDIINFPIDINGYKVVVGDTAGIRAIGKTSDVIEIEGIKRAKSKALESDLIMVMLPADANVNQLEGDFVEYVKTLQTLHNKIIKFVVNKVDLLENSANKNQVIEKLAAQFNVSQNSIALISCVTETGIKDLVESLTKDFQKITDLEDSDPVSLSQRSQDIIVNDILYGFNEFERAKEMEDVVLASEALKKSIDGIGKITGDAVGVEEILGVIFSTFCIGK